jgi:predicted ArsR family transcriptional regulator
MITARHKVLAHLKKTRAASAREIARALKMSAPNVRHHLSILVSDGRIEAQSVHQRGGRGRPEKMYSLPSTALGDNLSLLADAILDEKINMETVGKRIAQAQNTTNPPDQPMPKRLAALIETMNRMNYHARWEAGMDGPRIIFGHCPYLRVSEKHLELCKMDAILLGALLGRQVLQIVKVEKASQTICPFYFHVE